MKNKGKRSRGRGDGGWEEGDKHTELHRDDRYTFRQLSLISPESL